jgi:hypothetical protein
MVFYFIHNIAIIHVLHNISLMFLIVYFERATIWKGKLNVYSLHACVHSNLYNINLIVICVA